MKRFQFGYFILLIFFLQSCVSPSYFLPAITGNDISYMPRPMEADSAKSKTYVSMSIAQLNLPHNSGNLDFGLLNISRGHTFKQLNVAYGAFGFAGITSDEGTNKGKYQIAEFDGKGFLGGGLRTSIGFFDNMGNAEFRMLSWESSLSFENGRYSSFRKKYANLYDENVISASQTTLFTTGGASEIIWHLKNKPNTQFAFRFFYGFTAGLTDNLKKSNPNTSASGKAIDLAFYFKVKEFYGIINSGGNKGFTSKFSLGYAF